MKAITFFILMLTGISCFAQYDLKGTVSDSVSNELLSGASVWLENAGNPVITDQNGVFIIKNIKPGTYLLVVQFLGYEKYSVDIIINQNLTREIKLKQSSVMAEGIMISATRLPDKAPGSIQNIARREISQRNTGQDLPYILQSTPSAVSTSDAGNGMGYTGLRIRGTDMTRINVTVNGIPLNDPESHEVYFVDIPDIASSIENIQVQRGVGTSSNGASSFGASINIQTQMPGSEPYAEITNSFGSFNSMHNSIKVGSGLINKKFAVDARLSNLQSDGYVERSDSKLQSWFVTGTYLGKKSIFKLNAFSGHEITHQAWDGVPSGILDTNRTYNINGTYTDGQGNTMFYHNEIDDYRQDNYQLLYTYRLSNKSWINIAAFYIHGSGYYEQYKDDKDPEKFGLITKDTVDETDLICQKWLKNDYYGATWSINKKMNNYEAVLGGSINQYEGDHFGKVIWTQKECINKSFNYEWYRNTGTKNDFNIYSKLRYSLGKRINIYADLQYRYIEYEIKGPDDDYRDLSQNHSYNFYNPKAGFTYDINRSQNVQFSFAVANREPNRTNFKDADPGKTPKPERLFNNELSWNLTKTKLKSSICLYYMLYKDQLILTGEINDVGSPVMVNADNSYRAGIEFLYELNILSNLTWIGNINFSKNKINNYINYVDDWDNGGQIAEKEKTTDLSFSPEITANSNFRWQIFKGFSTELITKYVGKQYIDNTSSDERSLDPYLVNNIRFSYNIKTKAFRDLEIRFSLNNVLDEEYETNAWVYRYYYENQFNEDNGYFPQAKRNFMIGVVIGI